MESTISVATLKELYDRKVAIVLHIGSKGSDLLVPVKLANGVFTCIIIQVILFLLCNYFCICLIVCR